MDKKEIREETRSVETHIDIEGAVFSHPKKMIFTWRVHVSDATATSSSEGELTESTAACNGGAISPESGIEEEIGLEIREATIVELTAEDGANFEIDGLIAPVPQPLEVVGTITYEANEENTIGDGRWVLPHRKEGLIFYHPGPGSPYARSFAIVRKLLRPPIYVIFKFIVVQ